jgi:hypothetical protein
MTDVTFKIRNSGQTAQGERGGEFGQYADQLTELIQRIREVTRAAVRTQTDDPEFCDGKRDTADYYFTFVVPETLQLLGVIDACLRALGDTEHCVLDALKNGMSADSRAREAG